MGDLQIQKFWNLFIPSSKSCGTSSVIGTLYRFVERKKNQRKKVVSECVTSHSRSTYVSLKPGISLG